MTRVWIKGSLKETYFNNIDAFKRAIRMGTWEERISQITELTGGAAIQWSKEAILSKVPSSTMVVDYNDVVTEEDMAQQGYELFDNLPV
jgi:hypothetical protein